ncbi:glycoside hydrolase family 3 C-terminal domain-containing protein [Bacteroidota bacterium]
MKNITLILLSVILFCCCQPADKKGAFPYQDENLSLNERIDDLIDRMTLEEKVGQLNYDAPAIERLNIPKYNWWNECLHGVGRAGLATVFPQAIGLAASWNQELMYDIGNVISNEARAKHHEFARLGKRSIYYGLTFWTPNINIFRDPRWGRGQETYGEDPYLSGQLAVPFIKGLQGNDEKYLKLVGTAKHFAVHSGPESTRHSVNIEVSEIDLRETYLPAFEATVKEANVASIMCAYNRVRNEVCCGSNLLLNSILREEWNWPGYVVSDCWAIHDFYRDNGHYVSNSAAEAAALAFKTGTDLNCGMTSPHLVQAVEEGLITEDEIEIPLRRLMEARFKLGMFDDAESIPYSKIPYSEVRKQENLDLALKASRESIVLLKNNGILPLKKGNKKVAIIGPVANDYRVMLGNYHGSTDKIITPFKGIVKELEEFGAEVNYTPGCLLTNGVPLLKPVGKEYLFIDSDGSTNGIDARYFDNMDFEGDPVITREEEEIDFFWNDKTPVSGEMADIFSGFYKGYIKAPVTGNYSIGINACNGARFYFEDSLVIEFRNEHHPTQKTIDVNLKAGALYSVKIEYYNFGNDPQVHLLWSIPGINYEREAIDLANESDLIVLVMGLSPFLEGEEMPIHVEGFSGGDRTDIKLPETQSNLIQKIKALNKPTVLVLMGGSAVSDLWAVNNVEGILYAWYPGEFGGQAIADVLFGDYSPSGKLPVTFYKKITDIPEFENYNMEGRTYKYFNGEPLFPFGHGMSYTSFIFEDLNVSSTDVTPEKDIIVKTKVRNTGNMIGSEVAQLYMKDLEATVPVPNISLEGFSKIMLNPGEEAIIEFRLSAKQFAEINTDGRYYLEPGEFELFVGGKQPGFSGIADAGSTNVTSLKVAYKGDRILID